MLARPIAAAAGSATLQIIHDIITDDAAAGGAPVRRNVRRHTDLLQMLPNTLATSAFATFWQSRRSGRRRTTESPVMELRSLLARSIMSSKTCHQTFGLGRGGLVAAKRKWAGHLHTQPNPPRKSPY